MSNSASIYPKIQLYIDGVWREGRSDKTQAVFNPAKASELANFVHAGADDLEEALASSAAAFREWRQVSAYDRAKLLRRAADILRRNAPSYGQWMTSEQGKPIAEATGEFMFSADIIDWFAGEAQRCYGQVIPSRSGTVMQYSVYEAIGPVAAFTPWNFPVAQAARKVAAALAAGCSIILKGPEDTPASCVALTQALAEAGLPKGVLNLVFGDPATISSTLIADPRIRKVTFTGSTAVGKQLASLAGLHMKRVTMELGGHAPVLVFNDADISKAIQIMVGAKYRNAGQVCISPTRFLIQNKVYDQFVEKFAKSASDLRVGDGMDSATQMGPLATSRRVDAIQQLVEDARSKQAEIITGGQRIGNEGNFFAPTVIANASLATDIQNSEPFGPVALMSQFNDLEEAIAEANRLPYGLSSYVFASASNTLDQVCAQLETGMVSANQYGIAFPELPFGGVKDSGYGTEGGSEAIKAYLTTKFVARAQS